MNSSNFPTAHITHTNTCTAMDGETEEVCWRNTSEDSADAKGRGAEPIIRELNANCVDLGMSGREQMALLVVEREAAD